MRGRSAGPLPCRGEARFGTALGGIAAEQTSLGKVNRVHAADLESLLTYQSSSDGATCR